MADEKTAAALRAIDEALAAPGDACVTSSFQTECVALVHMLVQRRPEIPVLFLDTGYHFAETYAYRDQIAERLGLNLVNLLPKLTVPEQEAQFGILNQTEPTRCCQMRKVEPLFAGLQGYDTWFTGLRRDQSPTRANLKVSDSFTLPTGKALRKISPLTDWTNADVWSYLKHAGIPVLPLYDRGYTSIGCEPCTQLPFDPDNPRSGRWGGNKLECGIHIQAK
ncbi:MAG TPA: phosphoadenylyl-sulfate reductase [Bryobacteraceae bacterium]|nr:phosphoadenylyl-sulfate reductase [Bryobacteraceae bacterium]